MTETRSEEFRMIVAVLSARKTPDGSRWEAKCPAHPDRSRSLLLSTEPDGGPRYKCHGPCKPDAVAVQVRALLAVKDALQGTVIPPGVTISPEGSGDGAPRIPQPPEIPVTPPGMSEPAQTQGDNVPTHAESLEPLMAVPNWVAWKRVDRNAKVTKVPVNPRTGAYASVTDPATWGTYHDAASRAFSRRLAGVGFVLTGSDGFVCVDLDHVRDRVTGMIDQDACEIVNLLDTYTEVSPSGDGLHLWMRATIPAGGNRKALPAIGSRDRGIEIYGQGRYMTVTFAPVDGHGGPINHRNSELASVHARFIAALAWSPPIPAPLDPWEPEVAASSGDGPRKAVSRAPESSDGGAKGRGNTSPTTEHARRQECDPVQASASMTATGSDAPDDDGLRTRMLNAPNGRAIQALFNGILTAHADDHSAADQALCNHLAFWTNGDRTRIDRMFRLSRLMRDKWDRPMRAGGETYGEATISKAIAVLPVDGGYRGAMASPKANRKASAQPSSRNDAVEYEEFRTVTTVDNPDDADTWTVEMGGAAHRGLAGEVVRALSLHTEADPASILATFLTAFGVAVGIGPVAEVGGTRHHPRTHTLIVGDTAVARKGDSLKAVNALMDLALEDEWRETCTTGLASGEGLIAALSDDVFGKDTEKRRFITESEFARTLGAGKRENSILSSVLRQAWDDDFLSTMTKAKVTASHVHVAVLGHITQGELARESSILDVVNGFMNRFLLIFASRRRLLPSPGSVRAELVTTNLPERVHMMVQVARKKNYMVRDQEARALWDDLYTALNTTRRPDIEGRAEAMVLRLAMIYALLEGLDIVGTSHIQSAAEVWWYSVQSARRIYGYGTGTGDPLADRIVEYLKSQARVEDHVPTVMQSEIQMAVGRNARQGEVNKALLLLERRQLISKHRRIEPELGRSGRPPVFWRLAPASATVIDDTPDWLRIVREWKAPSGPGSSSASDGEDIPSFPSNPLFPAASLQTAIDTIGHPKEAGNGTWGVAVDGPVGSDLSREAADAVERGVARAGPDRGHEEGTAIILATPTQPPPMADADEFDFPIPWDTST